MSFSLDPEISDALFEASGWLIPLAVLIALAGVLADAFRGSRSIPRFWGLLARLVLGLLLLALGPALYFLAWAFAEVVRSRSSAEMFLVSTAGFITLALGMGLPAWFFLLQASRRPAVPRWLSRPWPRWPRHSP